MQNYSYISIIALFFYCFIFLTFLAAKKVKIVTINEQIQNIAQKKDTLCRMMYN